MSADERKWLRWAREIQALAQTGLHYARNDFERERAQRLLEIAANIIDEHSSLPATELMLAFTAQPGYVTPKIDVRGAVIEADQLLLVREAIDGGWTLPGGWADVGESPRIAVEREVLEETGITVEARLLVGVYDANRVEDALSIFHAYKLVFLCRFISGEIRTSAETTEVGMFGLGSLPQPYSKYRTTPRVIEDSVAAYLDSQWHTVFD
jgi:ADP-ribose pyrophosphatase YjhB (NUDIX family)